MLRIRHQYWFCLAALCLVGSLVMLWSGDLEVAEGESSTASATNPDAVFRRLGDLPALTSDQTQVLAEIPLDRMPFETPEMHRQVLRVPAAIGSRRATPLNTTPPTISRNQITSAGFQSTVTSPVPDSVWLSGKIEVVDPVN